MNFKEQDHGDIFTVDQLQTAILDKDIRAYDCVIWSGQRKARPPSGTCVVTPADGGYRLTSEERSSMVEEGIFPDQASVVRAVLDRVDPRPPQTPRERARAAAAGRRVTIDNAEHGSRVDAAVKQRIEEKYGSKQRHGGKG